MSVPVHTTPVAELGFQRYFSGTLSAVDYVNTETHRISPVSMSYCQPGGQIEFILPQLDGAQVYIMNEMFMTIGKINNLMNFKLMILKKYVNFF